MRKDCELTATVKLPAEAESYKVQTIAEGKRTQTLEMARAEAERIRKVGGAEALAIELVSENIKLFFVMIPNAYIHKQVGKAEAERMRMKASVYKQYGDAAIMNIVLDSLPKVNIHLKLIHLQTYQITINHVHLSIQIAAEVAAPLAKTEEIVLIGGNDSTTGDITRLVGQIPPAVNALTGVDLTKVLGKIPGAKVQN